MKLALLLKARNGRRGLPRVSFFPFLAVLICTMGALVLLLLTVTRQARLQAIREAAERAVQRQTDAQAGRQQAQARIEDLRRSCQATESELAAARSDLERQEAEAGRLRGQLRQIETACKDLDAAGTESRRKGTETQASLQQVQSQIADAERRLIAARQSAQRRGPSYAIIPYQGPNETHRRPIYLECRDEAILLQPEGIAFTVEDFEGALGSDSPLAAALRVVRDYHPPQPDAGAEGLPYPLLLVRPSGIPAYYAAREAIKSYGTEFGYELIGEQWDLRFPTPDPTLDRAIREAIAAARVRQQERIAAAPRPSGRRANPVYRVGAKGGLTQVGGSSGDSDDSGPPFGRPGSPFSRSGPPGAAGSPGGDRLAGTGFAPRGTSGAGGPDDQRAPGGGGLGTSATGGRAEGAIMPDGRVFGGSGRGDPGDRGMAPGGGLPGGPYAGDPGGLAMTSVRGSAARPGAGVPPEGGTLLGEGSAGPGSAGVPRGPSERSSGPAGRSGSGGAPAEALSGPAAQSSGVRSAEAPESHRGLSRVEGYVAGRPADGSPPPEQDQLADGPPGMPLRPGEWHPSEPPPRRPAEEPEEDPHDRKDRRRDTKRLSEERGHDWALRDAARTSSPVSRTISVACYPDRLVVLPDQGKTSSAIPLERETAKSIDKFISAIWVHMNAWGIAGKGMYWRPILHVYVAPGAEDRFAELSALLEGSGLVIERKP